MTGMPITCHAVSSHGSPKYRLGQDCRAISGVRLPAQRPLTQAQRHQSPSSLPEVLQKVAAVVAPALAAAAIWSAPTLAAEDLTIKFKASPDPAFKAAQQTLVEAWGYANLQFLDQSFNGLDWKSELQVAGHSARAGFESMLLSAGPVLDSRNPV